MNAATNAATETVIPSVGQTRADAEGAILLGVGPEGHLSEGTVHFVVTVATQLGVGVEVVHAVPSLVGGPTGTWDVGLSFQQLVEEGQAGLDDVVQRLRERLGGAQPVNGDLVRGGVVDTLVSRSSFAQLVVLERRSLGRLERWTGGSVSEAVAARAHAPVVSVPAAWRPSPARRPITVGVEDGLRAASEVWTALGLAVVTDAPVVVLRATYLAPALEELLRHEVDHKQMLETAAHDLAHDVDLPAEVCDRVPCTFKVRWGRPADVLVAASEHSSLLVVARRDPVLPLGSHLGPIVRQVLRESACPVLVVEPSLSVLPAGAPSVSSAAAGSTAR